MTDTTTPTTTKAPETAPKARVSGNPALVEWPRDEWGTLSELRQALLRAASTVRGNDEKHKLFLATLGVGAQHAQSRFNSDKASVAAEGADEERRIAALNTTGRVYGQTVG